MGSLNSSGTTKLVQERKYVPKFCTIEYRSEMSRKCCFQNILTLALDHEKAL